MSGILRNMRLLQLNITEIIATHKPSIICDVHVCVCVCVCMCVCVCRSENPSINIKGMANYPNNEYDSNLLERRP